LREGLDRKSTDLPVRQAEFKSALSAFDLDIHGGQMALRIQRF